MPSQEFLISALVHFLAVVQKDDLVRIRKEELWDLVLDHSNASKAAQTTHEYGLRGPLFSLSYGIGLSGQTGSRRFCVCYENQAH